MDAKTELVSDKGAIKHAALTLYGYYCKLRNGKTGLCHPKPPGTARVTGIPRTNVIMLQKFLDEQNWILVYESGLIRPLKGFYSNEDIFFFKLKNLLQKPFFCLIIRQICLINRQTCLMIRQLFKGSLNQPIEPAQLTGFSPDSPNAKSATATADKNFDKFAPAGKPAHPSPASPQKPANGASAEKPADKRIKHPAVAMVKEITGRYPPKDQWDKIIREIREAPDIEFFRSAWEIWRSFDGNRMNLQGWLFLPNERGKLPEVYGRTIGSGGGVGGGGSSENGKPPPPVEAGENSEISEKRREALKFLSSVEADGEDISDYAHWYEEDWAWLESQLKTG